MFASSYYPSCQFSHSVPCGGYDIYPTRRHFAEQRELLRLRELEQQRRQVVQRLHRNPQYSLNGIYDDCGNGQLHIVFDSLERDYREERQREALKRRLRDLRQERVRQEIEQRRCAQAQALQTYLQSLQDRNDSVAATEMRKSSVPSHPSTPQSTHSRSTTPALRPVSPPESTSPSAPPHPSPERFGKAATRIQTTYRIHRAISEVTELEQQFIALRSSFTLPSKVDYQGQDGVISISTLDSPGHTPSTPESPKLAFTSTNHDLHVYSEGLNQLLVKLDAVNSWGNATVRRSRRKLVAQVEAEAIKLEEFWKKLWDSSEQGTLVDPEVAMNEVEEEAHFNKPTDTAREGSAPRVLTEESAHGSYELVEVEAVDATMETDKTEKPWGDVPELLVSLEGEGGEHPSSSEEEHAGIKAVTDGEIESEWVMEEGSFSGSCQHQLEAEEAREVDTLDGPRAVGDGDVERFSPPTFPKEPLNIVGEVVLEEVSSECLGAIDSAEPEGEGFIVV